jgi:restriction system protein
VVRPTTRERRERIARARERTQRQLIKQIEQDREQAQRRTARADAAERRRLEQLGHEAGLSAAMELKAQVDSQEADLNALLTSALQRPPRLSFALLKQSVNVDPFEPGHIGRPLPPPEWEDFAPSTSPVGPDVQRSESLRRWESTPRRWIRRTLGDTFAPTRPVRFTWLDSASAADAAESK